MAEYVNSTEVKIWWDEPSDEGWLCPDNIAVALHAHCKNTKFRVEKIKRIEIDHDHCELLKFFNVNKFEKACLRIKKELQHRDFNMFRNLNGDLIFEGVPTSQLRLLLVYEMLNDGADFHTAWEMYNDDSVDTEDVLKMLQPYEGYDKYSPEDV